ncbi:MAG TPA: glycosyltransferase [Patescibacteria group bacterium]|nr:glycosyltransferase [Patescibacteria group bacterium]
MSRHEVVSSDGGAADGSRSSARLRAVLLVANPAAPYSRALRVGRSLAKAGFEVEVSATTGRGEAATERDGALEIVRYEPTGPWARFDHERRRSHSTGAIGRIRRLLDGALKLVAWPVHVRGWWRTLERDLPPADLYHAFGILTIPVAIGLARAARRRGRQARVVYDVIDVILESNNVDRIPRPFLAFYRWRERRWIRTVDAVVTVNDAIADHLGRTWPIAERPTVLLNCQPRWSVPVPRPDLIRATTGIPAERRIVLFLGRLGRERGLDEAAEAVIDLDDAALVLLGFGPWADRLGERDREPRFAGRHVTLPAVHPDDVPAWTASADVSIIAVPANSLNQRLSTPNKFWESLTAGTPMLVGRDLEVMRSIVEEHRIGVVADPLDRTEIVRALRVILDASPDDRAAMRERCLQVAAGTYNWETSVRPYLALVQRLTGEKSRSMRTRRARPMSRLWGRIAPDRSDRNLSDRREGSQRGGA